MSLWTAKRAGNPYSVRYMRGVHGGYNTGINILTFSPGLPLQGPRVCHFL